MPTCKLTTVVGGALKDMPHIPEPTRDDVAKWAKVYEAELRSLFERNRAKYALDGDAATLEVF